jgi:hypothetical protein
MRRSGSEEVGQRPVGPLADTHRLYADHSGDLGWLTSANLVRLCVRRESGAFLVG